MAPPLDLARFWLLQTERRFLIKGWLDRALSNFEHPFDENFESFMYTYISFNGWATCVTNFDLDTKIINTLGQDVALNEEFDLRLKNEAVFSKYAREFQDLWPIFSGRDARSKGINPSYRLSRLERIAEYRAGDVQFKPHGDCSVLNLANTLWAIYQVRCNLFHGDKSIDLEEDGVIVERAFKILACWYRRQIDR